MGSKRIRMPVIGSQRRREGPARRLFRGIFRALLWGSLALVVLGVFYSLALRRSALSWGASAEEVRASLPGDGLIPRAAVQATRAITIRASPEAVWPWLVQLGQGRGGFYSYDALENLIGCDIHSADRIVPELQELKVGDLIRLVPESYVVFGKKVENGPRYWVESLEPNRALVLRAPPESTPNRPGDRSFASSWAFVLQPIDAKTTRLLVRSRAYAEPGWLAPVIGVEPIHFLMEERMLRGIRDRAEATAAVK